MEAQRFKKWWTENKDNFRRRGGDKNGKNIFYHETNLMVFGQSDFEPMDLNDRSRGQSVWQNGWGPIIWLLYADKTGGVSGEGEARFAREEAEMKEFLSMDIAGDIENVINFKNTSKANKEAKEMKEVKEATNNYMAAVATFHLLSSLSTSCTSSSGSLYASVNGGGDKYKAQGDFLTDFCSSFGYSITGYQGIFSYGAGYTDGKNFTSINAVQNEIRAGKILGGFAFGLRVAGAVGTGFSISNGYQNFKNSDRSFGRFGQLGVTTSGSILSNLKHPAVIGLGIGIAVTDYYGGFNEYYRKLDRIEQTHYKYINLLNYLFNGFAPLK